MTHFTRQELNRWLDEGVSVKRIRHLETCNACSIEARRYRSMVLALEQLPAVIPQEGFADRVMARLQAEAATLKRAPVPRGALSFRPWIMVGGSGAVALATMTGAVVWAVTQWDSVLRLIDGMQPVGATFFQAALRQGDAVYQGSWLPSIGETVTAHGGAMLAGAAALMSLYIVGCAVMVRLLRAPRSFDVAPHSS